MEDVEKVVGEEEQVPSPWSLPDEVDVGGVEDSGKLGGLLVEADRDDDDPEDVDEPEEDSDDPEDDE